MNKALWPAVAVALLVIIAVLLLRNPAEPQRQVPPQVVKQPAPDRKEPGRDGDLIGDAKQMPGKVIDVLGGFLPGAKKPGAKKPGAENDPVKDDPGAGDVPRERTRPQDLVSKAFAMARDAAKAADDAGQAALAISPKEELELGRELREEIAKQLKFAERPEQLERIKKLAAPVLARRTRKVIEYQFNIVEDPALNAFSILGGSIYVHTGLLDRQPSDAELQGVIGHEIGHVDLKHCLRSFTYSVRTGELGGDIVAGLTSAAYQMLRVAYSEDQEFAADEFAFRALVKSGQTKQDSLAFTKFLLKADDEAGQPREQKRSKNVLDTVGREISNHYRTHPPNSERVHRLEALKLDEPPKR